MSLQLTKPVGYSFVLNYVQGRIAKANAAKAALDKAGTSQGPSQYKARATPFQAKAKEVCATPGTSILVTAGASLTLSSLTSTTFLEIQTPVLSGIYPRRLL